MTTLYGIPNCDTVRKARRWLKAHAVPHAFHDLRADGITATRLRAWLKSVGTEALVNRRSTAWRQLNDAERPALTDETAVVAALQTHPTLIKRPVLEHRNTVLVGFDEPRYRAAFETATPHTNA